MQISGGMFKPLLAISKGIGTLWIGGWNLTGEVVKISHGPGDRVQQAQRKTKDSFVAIVKIGAEGKWGDEESAKSSRSRRATHPWFQEIPSKKLFGTKK